jgi:hypothetical protein
LLDPKHNRHPADRLADLRAQQKALEREIDTIRGYLIRHPEDLVGTEYQASIDSYRHRHLDWAALERAVGKEVLERFASFKVVDVVRLRERKERAA